MKPNTYYATLEGDCVQTSDDLSRTWLLVRRYKREAEGPQTVTTEIVKKVAKVKEDPWAAPTTSRRRERRDHDAVLVRDAMRLRVMPYDREGTPQPRSGSTRHIALRPESIGGLWSDFVKLHPTRIISNFVDADAVQARNAARRLIEAELATMKFPPPADYKHGLAQQPSSTDVTVDLVTWNEHGVRSYTRDSGLVDFTLRPKIVFDGYDSVNMLLGLLGLDPIPVVGPQDTDPVAIKKHVRKLVAGLALQPETSGRCEVSDLLETDCEHCKTA